MKKVALAVCLLASSCTLPDDPKPMLPSYVGDRAIVGVRSATRYEMADVERIVRRMKPRIAAAVVTTVMDRSTSEGRAAPDRRLW